MENIKGMVGFLISKIVSYFLFSLEYETECFGHVLNADSDIDAQQRIFVSVQVVLLGGGRWKRESKIKNSANLCMEEDIAML